MSQGNWSFNFENLINSKTRFSQTLNSTRSTNIPEPRPQQNYFFENNSGLNWSIWFYSQLQDPGISQNSLNSQVFTPDTKPRFAYSSQPLQLDSTQDSASLSNGPFSSLQKQKAQSIIDTFEQRDKSSYPNHEVLIIFIFCYIF